MRLIDADALFPDGVDKFGAKVEFDDVWETTLYDLRMYIQRQPTIDPVKHGHWIEGEGTWYCSVCGKEDCDAFLFFRGPQFDLYCPKCGAKMDEVSE